MNVKSGSIEQHYEEKIAKLRYWRLFAQFLLGVSTGSLGTAIVFANFIVHTQDLVSAVEFGWGFYLFISLLFMISLICLRDRTMLGEILDSLAKSKRE